MSMSFCPTNEPHAIDLCFLTLQKHSISKWLDSLSGSKTLLAWFRVRWTKIVVFLNLGPKSLPFIYISDQQKLVRVLEYIQHQPFSIFMQLLLHFSDYDVLQWNQLVSQIEQDINQKPQYSNKQKKRQIEEYKEQIDTWQQLLNITTIRYHKKIKSLEQKISQLL